MEDVGTYHAKVDLVPSAIVPLDAEEASDLLCFLFWTGLVLKLTNFDCIFFFNCISYYKWSSLTTFYTLKINSLTFHFLHTIYKLYIT